MELVIIDIDATSWKSQLSESSSFRILPLEYPVELFQVDASNGDSFVDVSDIAQYARQALREFVPSFYSELPNKMCSDENTLAAHIFSGKDELWWLTDFSEKSIFRGKLIKRLYSLALIHYVVQYLNPDKLYIELQDTLLVDCLEKRYVGKLRVEIESAKAGKRGRVYPSKLKRLIMPLVTSLELLITKTLLLGTHNKKKMSPLCANIGIFSFFPVWWREPWQPDVRKDAFFQDIFSTFQLQTGVDVQYLCWLSGGITVWLKNIKKIRQAANSQNFLFLQSICPSICSQRLFSSSILGAYDRIRSLPSNMFSADFYRFDIAPLVQHELLQSICGRSFYLNVLLRESFQHLTGIDSVVFRTEFQPFERAILQGLTKDVTTFGFQHSSIGEDYLSHVFSPSEINNSSIVNSVPVSDYILCTGQYSRSMMIRNGFSFDQVFTCGAVRYPELRDQVKLPPREVQRASVERPLVFVPVPLDEYEARCLAVILSNALSGSTREFRILLKGHPSINNSGLMREVLNLNPNLAVEEASVANKLYDLLCSSNVVLTTGSTIGLEALALNIPVILYRNNHMFSYISASLVAIGDAVSLVDDAQGIASSLLDVANNHKKGSTTSKKSTKAVTLMMGDLINDKPEEVFVEVVLSHI
ncbi:hypothetical protein ACFL2V_01265 [Pseudomonadota bacterium]